MAEQKNDFIKLLDWFVWEIVNIKESLYDFSKNHTHPNPNPKIRGFSPLWDIDNPDDKSKLHHAQELENAKNQLKKLEELKNQILESKSPIVALHEKIRDLALIVMNEATTYKLDNGTTVHLKKTPN